MAKRLRFEPRRQAIPEIMKSPEAAALIQRLGNQTLAAARDGVQLSDATLRTTEKYDARLFGEPASEVAREGYKLRMRRDADRPRAHVGAVYRASQMDNARYDTLLTALSKTHVGGGS